MIDSYEFGKFTIKGKKYQCNVKLIKDEVIKTRHFDNHIIKLDDFLDLVKETPEFIIIGTGAHGVIQVPREIIDFIELRGIKLIIEQTGKACREYNRLIKQGKTVCALLHYTC
ncbi:Mth938-like domain-containing protein [Candidatus Woesearchaeota archaeon]|nr:Mth938-like domain-containing protein [Candidatus Woesearchaeota archaeon]